MKVDIFGSCVTRDAFAWENPFTINRYFARTSMISQYSKALNMKEEDIHLPSKFQQRMVYNDLQKMFRRYIQNPTSDYLIIDLIDERMNLIKVKQGPYITRSTELVNAKLKVDQAAVLKRLHLPEHLWFDKAALFIDDVKKKFDRNQIILHKVFWQEKYRTAAGELKEFENRKEIRENNELLHTYYSFMEDHMDGIHVIDLNGKYYGDETHRWGKSPFHFEEEYYKDFLQQLHAIIDLKDNRKMVRQKTE
ncbi:hypothetical protein BABA_15197 [Neobacillus bataviensis LMG 21833]|uniref:Uncharacterized protein n=1 Tax=Neobacillus bataviensis LMG 21833 TaxID=1117379 RepID=K6D1U6_9BACI|nr:DUF6270 domain-containing protein [Neobacillus bataviensis]EKN66467.1 hypothetical protein BABA_15197 [Neobacillus bataviensis LMG 21833]